MIWTPDLLRAFEQDIAEEFNAGKIRAPIHLDGGNEEQLIKVFQNIHPEDWVCGSWRMHYKCLLKGVPPERLKADIMAGRSITLCYPEYHIISSAIVGGILPIALGIAASIKRRSGMDEVHCFLGDMTARTGMYHECQRYAAGFDLPINWIIEDNGKSVGTDTRAVWSNGKGWFPRGDQFTYELPWPHSGAGRRVEF